MTETANLLVQVSRGSGVLGRLGHERRNSGLLGGRSEAVAIVGYVLPQSPAITRPYIYTPSAP